MEAANGSSQSTPSAFTPILSGIVKVAIAKAVITDISFSSGFGFAQMSQIDCVDDT